MGYYSHWTVRAHGAPGGPIIDFFEWLENHRGYAFEMFPNGSLESTERYKWYESEEDLSGLSSRLGHGVLIEVFREGEEGGDAEFIWFHDGEVQKCVGKMVFPPMDPAEFSDPDTVKAIVAEIKEGD